MQLLKQKILRKNGIIDEPEILVPGDTLITASGTYNAGDFISFESPAKLGEHTFDVCGSYISAKKRVIHNAVPVAVDGNFVSI